MITKITNQLQKIEIGQKWESQEFRHLRKVIGKT